MSVPRHLWVVGVLALLWNLFGALDYLMTQTRNEAWMARFTPEQLDYFYAIPPWAVAAWAIAVWSAVLGSILLLLRREAAATAFLVSLLAMIASNVNTLRSGGFEVMGGAGPVAFTALIFVVGLFLWLYSRAMAARDVLV